MKWFGVLLPTAIAFLSITNPSHGQNSSTFYANSANIAPNYSNKIRLGLFSWGQATDGKMYANFYMENGDNRDVSRVEITCVYSVVIPNYPTRQASLKVELYGANLAWQGVGPEVLGVGKGRNYPAVYFGQLEPISWVQNMMCSPTAVKY